MSDIFLDMLNHLHGAKLHVEEFIKAFHLNAFNIHTDKYEKLNYSWLREHNPAFQNEYPLKENNEMLTALYSVLQTWVIAFEQIGIDRVEAEAEFNADFQNVNTNLKMAITELKFGLEELKIEYKEVDGSIKPNDFIISGKDETHRNLRDWLTIRDYLQTLRFFEEKLQSVRKM